MTTKIGIITTDNLSADPSLKLFDLIKSDYNCEITIINPSRILEPENVKELDILYPRITGYNKEEIQSQISFFKTIVQNHKVPYIGNLEIVSKQKDKFFQYQTALLSGLKAPKTILLNSKDNFETIAKRMGAPFVLKACYSFGGLDVHLISNQTELDPLSADYSKFIAQEFIRLDRVIDYRAYVVGGEVVGGLKRENKKEGEFRSNTSQGAIAEFFLPDSNLSNLAKSYANYIKAEILSVDFIEKDGEYYFIESNDAFSVKNDNEPQKIVIARAILEYCKFRSIHPKEAKWR